LAINSLELLDRKHCEMHPSWLSFAVKLTAFLVTFFAVEKSDWHVGPPPTNLNLNLNLKLKKNQKLKLTLTLKSKSKLKPQASISPNAPYKPPTHSPS
jgi:hypothetical protein